MVGRNNHSVRLAVAGADLVWEKNTADWLADKPAQQSEYIPTMESKLQ